MTTDRTDMHVLIYDPVHYGHHLHWVKLMVRALTPYAGRITFATTTRSARSPEFAEHLGESSGAFMLDDTAAPVQFSSVPFEGVSIARRAWLELSKAVKRHRPDHVFVPYGDQMALAPLVTTWKERDLGLPPSCIDAMFLQVGGIGYHRELRIRRRLRAYSGLMGLKRLPFGRLIFMDAIVHDWLRQHCPSLSRRCFALPDPVSPVRRHDKSTARSRLGLGTDGRLISCVGVLDERKGVDEFVRSFASAPLGGTDRLLLAGRASPAVDAAVREATGRIGENRIISINRILTAAELELAVSAADLVATTYHFPSHLGSASVLIRAAAAGRPVLASKQGWLGHMTRSHSLGWLYPATSGDRPHAIAECLRRSVGYIPSPESGEFAEYHSVDSFCQVVTAPFRFPLTDSQTRATFSNPSSRSTEFAERGRLGRAAPDCPSPQVTTGSFDAVPVSATNRRDP
jgi:glycosyltransferase involved in cell wall biosynthesis